MLERFGGFVAPSALTSLLCRSHTPPPALSTEGLPARRRERKPTRGCCFSKGPGGSWAAHQRGFLAKSPGPWVCDQRRLSCFLRGHLRRTPLLSERQTAPPLRDGPSRREWTRRTQRPRPEPLPPPDGGSGLALALGPRGGSCGPEGGACSRRGSRLGSSWRTGARRARVETVVSFHPSPEPALACASRSTNHRSW